MEGPMNLEKLQEEVKDAALPQEEDAFEGRRSKNKKNKMIGTNLELALWSSLE